MVVFHHQENHRYMNAEQTASIIKETMHQTGHKPEFHFTACSNGIRRTFFHKLNEFDCQFDICALIVDKNLVTSNFLKKNSTKFYNYFLKQLLTKNPIKKATIKIDGQKSKGFRKALQAYLRHENHGMITNLKFCDSRSDVLIQLADMACGAIAYRYNKSNRLDSDIFIKLLGKRLKNLWEFK